MTIGLRPLDLVLDRLHGVKENGTGHKALCPAHDDRTPSLHVGLGEDGRVLLHCYAGCTPEDIVAKLGLGMGDLFPPKERTARRVVAETDYRIRDEDGQAHGIHRRRDYSDGKKEVTWLGPDGTTRGLAGRKLETMPLYGSELLPERPDEIPTICEGEKAARAMQEAGYLALGTVTGAATAPDADVLASLKGRREVLLWPDNDVAGVTHMMRIARTLGVLGIPFRLVTWPDAPDKGDAYDYLALGGDVPTILDAATAPANAPNAATAPPVARRIIRAGDSPLAPPEYLIDGVLPKNGLASLVSKEASYKTFVAIAMAAAVHTGDAWAGHTAERAPVLYLAAEGSGGMRRRLRAWEIAHGGDLGAMWVLPASVNFLDAADLERLATEIATLEEQPRLIVVDTLARNMSGNENAAEDMGRFIAACDRLRTATGGTVLVIHHENKLGGYRGSTAFAGAMDCMIEARREGQAVTLSCKKQKDDSEFEPIHLAARVVELGFADRYGRPVTSVVLKPTDAAFVLRQREQADGGGRALSGNERKALDALNALPDRKATYSDWLRASDLPRNSFDRARQALLDGGHIRSLAGAGYAPTANQSPPGHPQAAPKPVTPTPISLYRGGGGDWGTGRGDEDTHPPDEVADDDLPPGEEPDDFPF